MADRFDKGTRSMIMSSIRGRDTTPEIILRKFLFKEGLRYRTRYRFKELNFNPDVVFVSKRICLFVDGCFWHECPKCYRLPRSNISYWKKKIARNIERDNEQNKYLQLNGWKVIRLWEHQILGKPNILLSLAKRIKRTHEKTHFIKKK